MHEDPGRAKQGADPALDTLLNLAVILKEEASPIRDASDAASAGGWTGANEVTNRLLRCLEAVRDLKTHVDLLLLCPAEARGKRSLKLLAVPLFTLYELTIKLFNVVQRDKDAKRRLTADDRQTIRHCLQAIEKRGLTKGCDLAVVRDKIGAHIDEVAVADPNTVWISVDLMRFVDWALLLLAAVSQALQMDIYGWSELGTPDDVWHLMAVDGVVMRLRKSEDDWLLTGPTTFAQSPKISFSEELLAARKAFAALGSLVQIGEGEANK